MPLYIRDPAVDRLTEDVMRATGAKNKTEAVRQALQAQLKAAQEQKSLQERIADLRKAADQIGPVDPEFDLKAFSDEQWDEDDQRDGQTCS